MAGTAAIKATFSDLRTVKGRKVMQIVCEVPIEEATAALSALGGVPDPSKDVWVAIARLNTETSVAPEADQDGEASSSATAKDSRPAASPSAPKRAWADLPPSQQASIRCGEFSFGRWITSKEKVPYDGSYAQTADLLRVICGVESRKDLDTDHRARMIWFALDTEYLQATGRLAVSHG